MIAGLPKAPSKFNPLANPPRALERRNYVLDRMLELSYIGQADHDTAKAQAITASRYSPDIEVEAPYVAEMVRADLVERFEQDAYTGGYSVYTTLGSAEQTAANSDVRNALDAYSERHGYHGPEGRLEPLPADQGALDAVLADRATIADLQPAIVVAVEDKSATIYLGDGVQSSISWSQMKWAQPFINTDRRGPAPKKATDILKPGDLIRVKAVEVVIDKKKQLAWRLAQTPRAAGALIALDPSDGAVRALVGGYDFYQSKFNRVTQAKRQPGSGFKAFIYSAALENGFTPASLINDAPVVFEDPSLEGAWRPENYSGKFFGPTRLRHALTKSRNLVSIRLLRSMGVEAALAHIANFGFDPDELPHNLSLALGSADLTPLQMATGYAVLANGGYRVEPYVIERIEQDGAGLVFEAQPKTVCEDCTDDMAGEAGDPDPRHAPRVLDQRNRYLMYSMMQDVIRQGTATKARELGRKDLAGKTGTTNDQRDAWFNGFNQHLVANVWVGFDDNSKLGRGEVGGRAALPAWMDFMRIALKDVPDEEPEIPAGIVTVRIDPATGAKATAATAGAIFEMFREENAPGVTAAANTDDEGRLTTPVVTPPAARDLF
jgi:penicillin-binding protein 1A